jgi:hypothetical protein
MSVKKKKKEKKRLLSIFPSRARFQPTFPRRRLQAGANSTTTPAAGRKKVFARKQKKIETFI